MGHENIMSNVEDTGRDCGHCGGRIVIIETEKAGKSWTYFNCIDCGCKWTLSDELFHVGNLPVCQQQHTPLAEATSTFGAIPLPAIIAVVILLLGLLIPPLRITAIFIVRALVPLLRVVALPLLIGLLLYGVVSYGRRQEWW